MYITVKESFKPSKRVSTEPKGDQSKIMSLFDNGEVLFYKFYLKGIILKTKTITSQELI